MATALNGIYGNDLQSKILAAKVFVVGAGGIGCELLKNLVLGGFRNIEVIDLDTIDVSNLNRQFLFHKQHVGKSKAAVAVESVLKFNPDVNIKHYHASVMNTEFDVAFFSKFDVVMNALDNIAARRHVNRMCLAAKVPLIESGSAGYVGQVELIKRDLTKCYECEVKRGGKEYPGCTIRNTPSEPIHCIVWSKHLFNQLFGEAGFDEEVSPDAEDPEAKMETDTDYVMKRKSTREWAEECNYDSQLLLKKLFQDDIRTLLSMHDLWKVRKPPQPLDLDNLPDSVAGCSKNNCDVGIKSMVQWSIAECVQIFKESLDALRKESLSQGEGSFLVWDKDDKYAMDFVAACSNIRAHVFHIEQNTRFEIKSMAGNIIPAIATTNAIIAGLVVLRSFSILQERFSDCTTVYLRQTPNHSGQFIVPEKDLSPPDPKCLVCNPNKRVIVMCNLAKMTLKELEDTILKKELSMVSPDAMSGARVVISSDPDERDTPLEQTLEGYGLKNNDILDVDDFHQNYKLSVVLMHFEPPVNEPQYEVIREDDKKEAKEDNEDAGDIKDDKEQDVSTTKRKLDIPETTMGPPKKRPRDTDSGVIVL